jgi:hypothetical protein
MPRFDTHSGVRYVRATFSQTRGVAFPASTAPSWFMLKNTVPTTRAIVKVRLRCEGYEMTEISSCRVDQVGRPVSSSDSLFHPFRPDREQT